MDEPNLPSPRQTPIPLAVPLEVALQAGGPPASDGQALLRWSQGHPCVQLAGDIDFSCAQQIHSLGRVLARHQLRAEVDASAVTFLDVAGLRAVLALGGEDQQVVVVRPSRCVLYLVTVLARCGAGLSVHPHTDRPEAVVVSGVRAG